MKTKNLKVNIEIEKDKLNQLCKKIQFYANMRNELDDKMHQVLNEYNKEKEELKLKENEEKE